MRYSRKYLEKKINDPFPPLKENERIYLNVPYVAKSFAQYCRCGFDAERKLWFTGVLNSNLDALINLYGINDATSEKAKLLLKEKLDISVEDKNS